MLYVSFPLCVIKLVLFWLSKLSLYSMYLSNTYPITFTLEWWLAELAYRLLFIAVLCWKVGLNLGKDDLIKKIFWLEPQSLEEIKMTMYSGALFIVTWMLEPIWNLAKRAQSHEVCREGNSKSVIFYLNPTCDK
jgi:hypothetical protein